VNEIRSSEANQSPAIVSTTCSSDRSENTRDSGSVDAEDAADATDAADVIDAKDAMEAAVDPSVMDAAEEQEDNVEGIQ